MKILDIRNAYSLESGAVNCEVLFDDWEHYLPYTATPTDSAETGRLVWQAIQSSEYEVTPFEVTPTMLQTAKEQKWQEINMWRETQEAQSITFEYAGRTWNADQQSMARLSPVAVVANTNSRDVMSWGDVNNKSVPLSVEQLKGLSEAMALALMERNNRIYRRQREMKDEVAGLTDLKSVRDFIVCDV